MEEIVQYVPMEKELMRLTEVRLVSNPEKVLKLTPTSKMLYRWMMDRYQHFNRLGKKFFDNQDTIAEAIGVTPRTVLNLIKDMSDFGLLSKSATKTVGAAHSNAYIMFDIFNKNMFITKGNGKLFNRQNKAESLPPTTQRRLNHVPAPIVEYEEIECPF